MRLNDELSLSDPARAAFYVIDQSLCDALGIDQCLHRTKTINHAKVSVAPIDELACQTLKRRRLLRRTRDTTGL